MAIPNDPGGSTTQSGGGLLGDYTKYEGPMMGPSGYGYYEVTYSGITGQPKNYTLTQSRDVPGSGGGGGSTSYVNIMGGQLGANRYTTYTDSSGNLWQVDNLDGSQSIIQKAPSNANPADKNNDGLDDTTNVALGVFPTKLSWTGFGYTGAQGFVEVWPNGAPAGPNPNPPAPPVAPKPGTWTGYGPQGQGTYYLDGPGGTAGTFIGTTVAPPKPTTTTSSGGGFSGGGGGGSSAPSRDWAGEQAAQNAFDAAQAEANREFQREMAAAKTEADMAIAEMNFAINLRRLGLDEKRFGVDAAETFGRLASSTDPLAFASFLHAGGGNIMNALGTGADALSSAALLPGARALQAMRGLGSNPTTGGGGATPTPTDPGAAPPATPPVVAPDTVNQGGRMVNTNTDPNHGVYQPRASSGEGGGALGGQAGINPYAGMQYEVIAGPTMPAVVPPPPPPPPPPDVPGGMAGGVQFDSPLPDQPPGTVYDSGTNDADRLYNDLYNRHPLPNKVVIPAFANGTMRGLGYVNHGMMGVGDAPGPNPTANGARPEIILNPTNAPIGVIPTPQARQMMRGLSRYAEGTWFDPYKTGFQDAQPVATTNATNTVQDAPSMTQAPPMDTPPPSSISDPALTTPPATTTPSPIGGNVPTGGYGLNPLTDAQLGVTAGDIPGMQEVLGLRQGTQVPNLNYYDIGFNDVGPTLQQMYFSGLQGRYGIPQQDAITEWQKYRMRGLSGGNLAMGV